MKTEEKHSSTEEFLNEDASAPEFEILKNWIKEYLRHKDLMAQDINSFEETTEGFIVKRKREDQIVLVKQKLEFNELKTKLEDRPTTLLVLNTKKNLEQLKKDWGEFSKYKKLTIIFANPKSQTETKWLINPYTHNLIADKQSLSRGLDAMFEMVDEFS